MANLQKIRELARQKKISLNEVASRVGITPQALSRSIRANSTTFSTAEKIASVLGVSVAAFSDAAAPSDGLSKDNVPNLNVFRNMIKEVVKEVLSDTPVLTIDQIKAIRDL